MALEATSKPIQGHSARGGWPVLRGSSERETFWQALIRVQLSNWQEACERYRTRMANSDTGWIAGVTGLLCVIVTQSVNYVKGRQQGITDEQREWRKQIKDENDALRLESKELRAALDQQDDDHRAEMRGLHTEMDALWKLNHSLETTKGGLALQLAEAALERQRLETEIERLRGQLVAALAVTGVVVEEGES